MKPSRLQHASTASRIAFVIFAFAALSGCEQNTFVPPPPPKVEVAVPVQKAVTRYLDATGNTAAIKNVDLVDEFKLMAGDKVCSIDQVSRTNRARARPQVGNCYGP